MIKINNQDTKYTIDSYQTFTNDSYIEQELEYYNEINNTNLDYDDFDWDYDMQAINKDFADLSFEYLKDKKLDNKIITKLELLSVQSPKEYNYQTDSYSYNVEYNKKALLEYIDDNKKAFDEYKKGVYILDDDELILYMITFYLDHFFDFDDYCSYMTDNDYEIYSNHITITPIKK